ncbi:hypothetical protein J1N35_040633 [Gossypium stocksii]|uniref:Aminotransferase-like plant mobile domain-containing protein n=1 Tax=Gossypium stocksii TaxID=47602 RepID=A0A9D3ZHX7_9ROSI|nr:hypothetical protein J1N35_040633 [Gossypium stocksii]
MVEKWRQKTLTFHFSCDEVMIMLEDVAFIIGIPIEGFIVTKVVNFEMEPKMICRIRNSMRDQVRPYWIKDH